MLDILTLQQDTYVVRHVLNLFKQSDLSESTAIDWIVTSLEGPTLLSCGGSGWKLDKGGQRGKS